MRKGFATLLVLFLSTMTCWASACDLSCAFQRFHAACAADQGIAPQPSVAVASDPPMANINMPGSSTSTQVQTGGSIHLHENSCTHSPCNETSVSAVSKSATHHFVRALHSLGFVVPAAAVVVQLPVNWRASELQPPKLSPVDPLSVSLRI
jgi:hypothetical protein